MTSDLLLFTGINILMAWSVYIVLMSGTLSFANGGFMAIGGYVAGALTVKAGLPLPLAMLVGAVLCALFAMAVAWPSLRTRGVYLILVTIGVSFCVKNAFEATKFFGGVQGMSGLQGTTVWLVWGTVLAVGLGLWLLSRTPMQRIMDAVREDEMAARSLGVSPAYVKTVCLGAGAAIAAVAGAFYAHHMFVITPEHFNIFVSVFVVLYVIMGGVNNLWGPVVGATIMTALPELIRELQAWRPTAFGLAIVILLLVRPEGLLAFRTRSAKAADARLEPGVDVAAPHVIAAAPAVREEAVR
ncbi:MAG: branched-chain amino acid ABC transporter permease [Caldimonas sp.]